MKLRREHRRSLAAMLTVPAAAILLTAGSSLPASSETATDDAVDPSTVRVLHVGAANTDGLLGQLAAEFEAESGLDVVLTQGQQDIMDRARRSEADLVLVHLGFTPLHDFVTEGRGRYPATILSNAVAFLVPPDDPAGIREVDDPYAAFAAIAASESAFVVNNLGETRYITDTLYEAAGRPDPGDWFLDLGLSGPQAVTAASQRGAYTLWGLHPFLQFPMDLDLEAELYDDSIMQRIIASTVVRRPPGQVNEEGALAFQQFLTQPATQATIRAFELQDPDHPPIDGPIFWPAANQNDN